MAIEELKRNCSNLDIVNAINNIIKITNSSFAKIENRSITIGNVTKAFDENGNVTFSKEELSVGSGTEVVAQQIHKYSSLQVFPIQGQSEHLYIAEDENAIYQWSEELLDYVAVGRDYEEVDAIDCGKA